ncbi:MAG TPA: carboxypeptidase-like regulatory domain-containing protein [Acidobacteriaceae bacterium]|nr:carboxypeptidase-like regulatory domain-containing protein [Acidobacteriaceae bacterium]
MVGASLLGIAVLALSVPLNAHAADANGRIKGVVSDPQGAVVPNAQVTATNTATGVKYTTTSQSDGGYVFLQLPVGTYSVSVAIPGFMAFSASGIVLNIDQEYVEAIKLTVGSTSDVVEVAANAVQVDTTDMQISNIVSADQMVELPLLNRNFTGLELTLPGVQASSDRFGASSVSGAQTQQSEFLINGADTNDIALNTLTIAPNLDAIAQFNLIDGPLNAEYDRNSGGIVSATIKQGTNRFHGDIFEYYRDTFLNTNNFFQKVYSATTGLLTTKVSPFHQNIFGGTIGGPVLRDKLFFFGAYQGTRQRTPEGSGQGSVFVYSAANLAGNFSDDLTGLNPGATPGTSSFSNNVIPSTISIPGCTPGQTWTACLTPLGGKVPTSAFNSISNKLVTQYVPAPNNQTYGYNFNETVNATINQYIGRVDYALNPKNQITALGIYSKSVSSETLPFSGASLPGFGDQSVATIWQYTADYVHQVSATAVNDLSAHYTRFNFQSGQPQQIVQPSSLGFAITPNDPVNSTVPSIAVGSGFTLGGTTNGPQPRIDQVIQLDDSFSKTLGHHNLKFGYDGRRFNVSNTFDANNSGAFGFGGSANTSGDGRLDFLLGNSSSYAQGAGGIIQADALLNYIYAQDSWKLSNALTINYGLGYSIDTPLRNHQYGGLGVDCFTPNQRSTVFTTAPLGLNFPGDPGCTNAGQAHTRHNEFGPRVGFAWAPDLGRISGSAGKLSVRGGFGIYYDRSEEESALETLESPPFGLTSSGANDIGGIPQFANPFQDINGDATKSEGNKFPYAPPTKGTVVPLATWSNVLEPIGISTFGQDFRAPYAENFQLTVQREFPSRVIATVGYVGSLARHNVITYEGNPETAAGHAACLADTTGCGSPLYTGGGVTDRNDQSYFYPSHTAFGQVDPATGGAYITSIGTVGSGASSNYNSLQASVLKGLTHGLTFQLSYTYAHAMDDGSSFENSGFGSSGRGYNQFVKSLNYGDSTFDARHRLVFSPIYISPIRSNSAWYSPLNLAISGWEISAIATAATGLPYDISYSGGSSASLYCSAGVQFYACPDIPVQNGSLVRGNPRVRQANGRGVWFQPSVFSQEVVGTFGNIHRNPYHGGGVNNSNIVIAKNFNLSSDGTRKLQIRMESDNAFNHTQFANPSSSASFGGPTATAPNATWGEVSTAAAARQTLLVAKVYF